MGEETLLQKGPSPTKHSPSNKILNETSRLIAAAHQRAGKYMLYAQGFSVSGIGFKLFRGHVAVKGVVFLAGRQVLADGDDGASRRVQVVHHLLYLVVCFAQSHHQAAFGSAPRRMYAAQQFKALLVAGLRAHTAVQGRVGFLIMIDDVGRSGHDRAQGRFVALKIGNKHLDAALGQGASDCRDGAGKMLRAAVWQIIPCHGCYDYVFKRKSKGRLGHAFRLIGAGGSGLAGVDVAEAAVARAGFAQNQKGGRARRVAFLPVGAVGRLAHGKKAQIVHQPGGGEKALV